MLAAVVLEGGPEAELERWTVVELRKEERDGGRRGVCGRDWVGVVEVMVVVAVGVYQCEILQFLVTSI